MDLLPSQEQDEIVESVRSILADKAPIGDPCSDDLWSAASNQGWFGLAIAESAGGVGYALAEDALLFAELGRHATPGPFLATSLAAHLATQAGNPEVASEIISGEARVSLAQPYDTSSLSAFDLADSTFVLVATPVEGSIQFSLYYTSAIATRRDIDSFDTLVPVSLIDPFVDAPVATASAKRELALRATVLVSATLAGIADATTTQSVSYGMDRQQFGQPIGGFQAVKHRCADMATLAEAAETQVRYAALAVGNGQPDAGFHAYAARTIATNAAVENARVNVQNHGGIGFTWEHSAHRYVTRADVLSTVLGNRATTLAALLAEPAPA